MFWKRKRKERKENPLQDKVAEKIAGFLTWLQIKFSTTMNKRVAGMNLKKLKVALLGFCLLSGGLSTYFFVDALVSEPRKKFKMDKVRIPTHFDKSGDEVMNHVMPDDIYQQLQDYQHYMDSIGVPIRPGLLDSMRIIEQIYLQQQK